MVSSCKTCLVKSPPIRSRGLVYDFIVHEIGLFFSLQDPLDSRLRPMGALFECPTVAVESTGPVGLIGCLVSDPTHPAEATADCKP
jgi:hypothetical protein